MGASARAWVWLIVNPKGTLEVVEHRNQGQPAGWTCQKGGARRCFGQRCLGARLLLVTETAAPTTRRLVVVWNWPVVVPIATPRQLA